MQSALREHEVHPSAALPPDGNISRKSGLQETLGRIGMLEVRLARDVAEIAAAQEVRYRVFYDELGARTSDFTTASRLDADRFDQVCDHLLVIDNSLPGPDFRRIVGTYRLLRQEVAIYSGGFYSQNEFDLRGLVSRHPALNFVELGRSCVLPDYRSGSTIAALWQGILAYVTHHGVDVMTGCASFHGVDPSAHAQPLSYLAQNCRAEAEWDACAVPDRYHSMQLLSQDAVDARTALFAMPPLIKGYLRLGARIGDGCVIDHEFGTTDVFIILPVKAISPRYVAFYSGEAVRFAA